VLVARSSAEWKESLKYFQFELRYLDSYRNSDIRAGIFRRSGVRLPVMRMEAAAPPPPSPPPFYETARLLLSGRSKRA